MIVKLIRWIKCFSVQEILMIVSILMLLIVIASRTTIGKKDRSASSERFISVQEQAAQP